MTVKDIYNRAILMGNRKFCNLVDFLIEDLRSCDWEDDYRSIHDFLNPFIVQRWLNSERYSQYLN